MLISLFYQIAAGTSDEGTVRDQVKKLERSIVKDMEKVLDMVCKQVCVLSGVGCVCFRCEECVASGVRFEWFQVSGMCTFRVRCLHDIVRDQMLIVLASFQKERCGVLVLEVAASPFLENNSIQPSLLCSIDG